MKRGSKLFSIFNNRCPRCNEGKFFISENPYDFKFFGKIPEKCLHCDLRFEPEPGFFFGAMYISYAINIAIFVNGLILLFIFDWNLLYWSIAMISLVLVLLPVIFRIARLIWINFFVSYDPEKVKKVN
jgi:uncharacterized protein (DUF983 family)